jgi:hypothetical protein
MRREIQLAGYTITAEEWSAFDEDTRELLLSEPDETLLEPELAQTL